MSLTNRNPSYYRTCAVAVASLVFVSMSGSKVIAQSPKVFGRNVSGVPAANPEAIADNVYSPEFAPSLVVEGIDLLENPSGFITRFGFFSDGSVTEPDENTYLILDHNPGG